MTIYLVDLEKLENRYTCEWKTHVPKLLADHFDDVVVIEGADDLLVGTTPGMFLNFATTNVYKASQVEKFSRLFAAGKIKDGDYFLFTDAWHPGILNLKYMADLLKVEIKIGGLFHAGNYDPFDGLGRLGNKAWIKHTELALFHALDHSYFATRFHIDMFCTNLLNESAEQYINSGKIVQTGWPMEYMEDTLAPYKNLDKKDLILFPHRISSEKQVEIFRDLAQSMPQYEFVVCQDKALSKAQYHTLLGESKLVFSASNQETYGIAMVEGVIVNSIPFSPTRLSYAEMYSEQYLYPSEWTKDWTAYLLHRDEIIENISFIMDNYSVIADEMEKSLKPTLLKVFSSADNLIRTIESCIPSSNNV